MIKEDYFANENLFSSKASLVQSCSKVRLVLDLRFGFINPYQFHLFCILAGRKNRSAKAADSVTFQSFTSIALYPPKGMLSAAIVSKECGMSIEAINFMPEWYRGNGMAREPRSESYFILFCLGWKSGGRNFKQHRQCIAPFFEYSIWTLKTNSVIS